MAAESRLRPANHCHGKNSRHGRSYQGETNRGIDSRAVYLKPSAQREMNSLAIGGLCLLRHVTRPPDAGDDEARTVSITGEGHLMGGGVEGVE